MFSFLYKYDYSLYVILALYFIFYANTVCVIICVAICKFILLIFTSLLFSIITICYNLLVFLMLDSEDFSHVLLVLLQNKHSCLCFLDPYGGVPLGPLVWAAVKQRVSIIWGLVPTQKLLPVIAQGLLFVFMSFASCIFLVCVL